MAFGGVPTGIMNAQLAPNVKGILNCTTENPDSFANAATIGTKITTKAKFESTSEAKIPTKTIIVIIEKIETSL